MGSEHGVNTTVRGVQARLAATPAAPAPPSEPKKSKSVDDSGALETLLAVMAEDGRNTISALDRMVDTVNDLKAQLLSPVAAKARAARLARRAAAARAPPHAHASDSPGALRVAPKVTAEAQEDTPHGGETLTCAEGVAEEPTCTNAAADSRARTAPAAEDGGGSARTAAASAFEEVAPEGLAWAAAAVEAGWRRTGALVKVAAASAGMAVPEGGGGAMSGNGVLRESARSGAWGASSLLAQSITSPRSELGSP